MSNAYVYQCLNFSWKDPKKHRETSDLTEGNTTTITATIAIIIKKTFIKCLEWTGLCALRSLSQLTAKNNSRRLFHEFQCMR